MSRIDRINQLMKREIGEIVHQDLNDPRFQFVSITKVKVSPDLTNAWVSFSFLGDKDQADHIQQALQKTAGIVRRLVSQRVDLRRTPRLEFLYDPSLEYSANVDQILAELEKERTLLEGSETDGREET